MTPSTTNTSLLFVTRQPAWEKKVRSKQAMHTDIFDARSGIEQRQGRQSRGRWSMEYQAVLNFTDAEARRVRTRGEVAAPLIVPFWAERGILTSDLVANVFSMDRTGDADWFYPGDYVLLSSEALGDQFRQIASIDGNDVTLEADAEGEDYLTGATVWPCRACIRDAGSAVFRTSIENSDNETLNYSTL